MARCWCKVRAPQETSDHGENATASSNCYMMLNTTSKHKIKLKQVSTTTKIIPTHGNRYGSTCDASHTTTKQFGYCVVGVTRAAISVTVGRL